MADPVFALGTFAEGGRPFTGLVRDGHVTPLAEAADKGGVGLPGRLLIDLMENWPRQFDALSKIAAFVEREGEGARAMHQSRVLPPIPPPVQDHECGGQLCPGASGGAAV